MTRPSAGTVLRRALVAWGLGHLALGLTTAGWALLVTEVVTALLVAWLFIGLANTSAYLVPFLAGVLFLVAWAWQALHAYRLARHDQAAAPAPERSEAVAIGWLAVPLLVWGAGFWLVAAHEATPSAALDRFVAAWTGDALDGPAWDPDVVDAAEDAARRLGSGPNRFRDVRLRVVEAGPDAATAVAESVHFERRRTSFLGLFPGSELVPVADEEILRLELVATPVPLPGGGDIGAVRWSVVDAEATR